MIFVLYVRFFIVKIFWVKLLNKNKEINNVLVLMFVDDFFW